MKKIKKVEDCVERFKSMMSRLYLHYKSEATSLDDQSANSESVVANQGGNRSKKEMFRSKLKRKEHVIDHVKNITNAISLPKQIHKSCIYF